MEKNFRKRFSNYARRYEMKNKALNCKSSNLKNERGITLVALVVTIIVLLILAGVSLNAVFNQGGIFNRAEQAVDKHGQAKARETLELALGEAQMQKYEEGLTEEELDDQIVGKIKGELLPKEKPENPNLQNVIVDGYIFEIDRSVPKIVDYIGPADGVIITALVTGNNGWLKPSETNVTVTGKIVTYSGGTITNVSATKGGAEISGFSIDGEGRYTINNITEDTIIVINAEDSNEKKNTRTIPITIKVDNIPPVVDSIEAKAEGLTIKFTATGHDNESGIKHFNYVITSTQDTTLTAIPTDKRTGTFTLGQTVEIITAPTGDIEETTYTITITATDNAGNTTIASSDKKAANVIIIDGITVAEAKRLVNANTLQQYIGTRVIDYNPPAGGTWRVFYYDSENIDGTNGYFGPINTIYLIRDEGVGWYWNIINNTTTTQEEVELMKKMNPKWANYPTQDANVVDNLREKCAAYMYRESVWNNYKDENYSSFAIGSPSVEMYMKAYNVFKDNDPNSNYLNCQVNGDLGYDYYVNGTNNGSETGSVLTSDRKGIFTGFKDHVLCLSSPSSVYSPNSDLCLINYDKLSSSSSHWIHPVVPIDLGF